MKYTSHTRQKKDMEVVINRSTKRPMLLSDEFNSNDKAHLVDESRGEGDAERTRADENDVGDIIALGLFLEYWHVIRCSAGLNSLRGA
jgi:hypothetical protein